MASTGDTFIPLVEIDESEQLGAVRLALTGAGVSYTLEEHSGGTWVLVSSRNHDRARRLVDEVIDDGRPEPEDEAPPVPDETTPSPIGAIQVAGAIVLGHLFVLFGAASPFNPGIDPVVDWGMRADRVLDEPWRLATHVVVHADVDHILWNALGLLVFSVPLIGRLGYRRAGLVYVAAGIGGGIAAIPFLPPPTLLIGSSGAVAGLFGGWLSLRLHQHALRGDGWQHRVRTWGIALLVLPSLLNPETDAGHPVSISAHLGGAATGAVVGALLAAWALRVRAVREPPTS